MIIIGALIIVICPPPPEKEQSFRVVPYPNHQPRSPEPDEILVTCDRCRQWSGYYKPERARRALAGHKNWCGKQYSYKGSSSGEH